MRSLALLRLVPVLLAAFQANAGSAHDHGHQHGGGDDTVDCVATAWYAGWHAQDFPLANVSWDKYTEMTYAFA